MRRRKLAGDGRRGFTLIELTLVVLVFAILTAVAAPKYTSALAGYRSNAAARRIAGDLRLARAYARKVSVAQTVTFDTTADSYAAATMPDPDRPGITYTVTLAGAPLYADVTAADFSGVASVQFDIYGRPNRSGTVTVKSGSRQCLVQLDAIGNVTIQ